MLAFLSGILADGKLHPAEVASLAWWLSAKSLDAEASWPLSTLCRRVSRAMADRKVDPVEMDELHDLFRNIVPYPDHQNLYRDMQALFPLTQPPPDIIFTGRVFVLTGRFLSSTFEAFETAIRELGGFLSRLVTEDRLLTRAAP
ncbi:MAG: hypothetical protein HY235_27525 [Acidobacteria bacterium]|nr:hypothetical protein [Acidobacteriota bacterium]